jgi:hypothetical protein
MQPQRYALRAIRDAKRPSIRKCRADGAEVVWSVKTNAHFRPV